MTGFKPNRFVCISLYTFFGCTWIIVSFYFFECFFLKWMKHQNCVRKRVALLFASINFDYLCWWRIVWLVWAICKWKLIYIILIAFSLFEQKKTSAIIMSCIISMSIEITIYLEKPEVLLAWMSNSRYNITKKFSNSLIIKIHFA